jgi:hypothetical protein
VTDSDTQAAIDALEYRVKARDQAIRDGKDYPDAGPFALEYLTALRGQGWRLTEAKAPGAVKLAHGGGAPSEATRAELEAARQRMAEAAAGLHRDDPDEAA